MIYSLSFHNATAIICKLAYQAQKNCLKPAYFGTDSFFNLLLITSFRRRICSLHTDMDGLGGRNGGAKESEEMNGEEDQVVFDTGCILHALMSTEGLNRYKSVFTGPIVIRVSWTSDITHIEKMLRIPQKGRVFAASK